MNSEHNAEAVALHEQAGVLLQAIIADEKAKQTRSEPQETALPLQPVQITALDLWTPETAIQESIA